MEVLNKTTSRRDYLKIGSSLLGSSLLLLSACKTRKSDSSGPSLLTSPKAPAAPLSSAPGQTSHSTTSTNTGTGNCQETKIDLATIAAATENLEAQMMIYGDSASAMLVVSLPKFQYSSGNLISVTIMLLPSGKVIAQKGIFEDADVNADTTLRPLLFENLSFRSDTQIAVIYKIACDSCTDSSTYQKFGPTALIYNNTFLSKPAYGLKPDSISAAYIANQVSLAFSVSSIAKDSLITDRGTSSFSPSNATLISSGFSSLYVTDLMGNILFVPQTGTTKTFSNIVNYPEFICYQLVNNSYIRTFVKAY